MHELQHSIAPTSARGCCPIVELRQYTLHPGARETLIELFDRELVETQEALGMSVLGQFRDLDGPNRFVWLRGFRDRPSRAPALKAFYVDGPVWRAHRVAANATMIDSDNVLLLRPARPESGFVASREPRPPARALVSPEGVITANIEYFEAPAGESGLEWFEHSLAPLLAESGAALRGTFVSEESPNDFPALPVREGVNALVWFAGFPDRAAHAAHVAALAGSGRWPRALAGAPAHWLAGRSEVLRLAPTARSLLRG